MKIGTLISAGVLMLSSMLLNSGCSEAGNGRKQTTENPGAIFGEVKSAAGAKMLTPIALRGDKKATGHLFFELSEPAEQEVAVTFKLDSRILDAYNQLNGTGYTMYPADKLLLENNGNVVVEAGKSKSATLALDILPGGTEGATYAVAVSAVATAGTEKHTDNKAFIYLVKPLAAMPEVNAGLQRVAAVDVFRALTMFLMLFVNDIPGLKNVPHWLMHAAADEDMLGFSDTIFPAFLFCMGMSVSFAIQNRYKKGDTTTQVIAHIFWRTVALIAMGLFSLNSGGIEGGLSHSWFTILMVIGFFLTWGVYPKAEGTKKALFTVMKVAGVVLLATLVIYKDLNGKPFHTSWWGILGLIGWTYAVCAGIYLFTRESLRKNAVAWFAVITLAVISHSGLIPEEYGSRILLLPFIPSDWTLHAFGMSGLLTSLLMQRYANREHPGKFIGMLCILGAGMLILALVSHPYWIISKIQATPSWLFYCLAAFFPLFGFFYWLTDVKGKTNRFDIIKPAGTATLTCYILPYIWYSVQQLAGWAYPEALGSGVPGLLKSLVFSIIIVQLTGLLVKGKIKLKV